MLQRLRILQQAALGHPEQGCLTFQVEHLAIRPDQATVGPGRHLHQRPQEAQAAGHLDLAAAQHQRRLQRVLQALWLPPDIHIVETPVAVVLQGLRRRQAQRAAAAAIGQGTTEADHEQFGGGALLQLVARGRTATLGAQGLDVLEAGVEAGEEIANALRAVLAQQLQLALLGPAGLPVRHPEQGRQQHQGTQQGRQQAHGQGSKPALQSFAHGRSSLRECCSVRRVSLPFRHLPVHRSGPGGTSSGRPPARCGSVRRTGR